MQGSRGVLSRDVLDVSSRKKLITACGARMIYAMKVHAYYLMGTNNKAAL